MDRTEQLAEQHLRFRDLGGVLYEPDGNVPPDFLVDGRIAVEVRRLNQNELDRPGAKGLEEVEIPLLQRFATLFASYGKSAGPAWWVTVRFKRPVPRWSRASPLAKKFLDEFITNPTRRRESRTILSSIDIEVFPRDTPSSKTFTPAITSDEDSGGWVIAELERNLRLCIKEKTDKVAPFRAKYPQWWLLFVDHIGFALDDFDRQQFRESVQLQHDWDKVILVNPTNHEHFFDL